MKKVCFVFPWIMIFWLCFVLIATAAEKTGERRYTVPGHGVLKMKVPSSWKDEVKQQSESLPPTIALKPASGNQFIIFIIPFWKESEDAPDINDYLIHRMVERAADANQPNVVEKNLKIIYLDGSSGDGYYFSATNKAPQKDDYKFLTQGALRVDELVVTFSILTNDEKEGVENTALEMIKSATHVSD
jgi:hypothetical protein